MRMKKGDVLVAGLLTIMDPRRSQFFISPDTWVKYGKRYKRHPFRLPVLRASRGQKTEISSVWGAQPEDNTNVFLANLRLHLTKACEQTTRKRLRIIRTEHPNGKRYYRYVFFEVQIGNTVILSAPTEVNGKFDAAAEELEGVFGILSTALGTKIEREHLERQAPLRKLSRGSPVN